MDLRGHCKSSIVIVLVSVFLYNCKKESRETKAVVNTPAIIQPVSFNSDSAYGYIAAQVSFGPRVPGTKSHDECGDYIIKMLQNQGWVVTVQEFTANMLGNQNIKSKNIIASINPNASKRILLAAHWDTRAKADQDPIDKSKASVQANDGGSGVGVLLEIARAIAAGTKPGVGIDLLFFDAEDNGTYENGQSWCLGSQYWSTHKHTAGYSAYFGLLFDMVGAKDAKFNMEESSMQYAGDVVKKVWQTAGSLGYSNYFVQNPVHGITDDHVYVNALAKIPMADIIEYDGQEFSPSWHKLSDNMDIIDKATLKAVGQTVLQVVYNE